MSETDQDPRDARALRRADPVYVVASDDMSGSGRSEISLLDFVQRLWEAKWIIIAVTLAFGLAAVPYALAQVEWYRAYAVLAPAEERSTPSIPAELGGLAGLAGVRVGGGRNAESIAVLRSRRFVAAFIRDEDLLPVLMEHADETGVTGGEADLRAAVRLFTESVLRVEEDSRSGLVTVYVEWTDPQVAAEWANLLTGRLNEHLRHRALQEAEGNLAYLRHELESTTVVALQQSIGRLLESELQKLMLARGNAEFAFRVVDPAEAPLSRSRPNRTLMVLTAMLTGGGLAVLGVFGRHVFVSAQAGRQD